jgi:hypothetical protein
MMDGGVSRVCSPKAKGDTQLALQGVIMEVDSTMMWPVDFTINTCFWQLMEQIEAIESRCPLCTMSKTVTF